MEFEGEEIDILAVLRDFNTSDLTYLRMVSGDVELVVSRLDTLPDDQPVATSTPSGVDHRTAATSAASSAPAESQPVIADAAAAPAPTPAADRVPEAAAAEPDPGLTPIPSPVVGIFYRAPAPGEDPYVAVGTDVTAGTTIGLVEAMKVFTAVAAGTEGTIEEILVANGDFVEVGQPLMMVRRATA